MNTPPLPLPGLRVLLADAGQRRSPVIRLELIRVLTRRALRQAWEKAGKAAA